MGLHVQCSTYQTLWFLGSAGDGEQANLEA